MNRPQRPLLWFLWPRPDPNSPVDGAYVQGRLVRITPRGPVRIALLLAGTILTTLLAGTAVIAAVSAPFSAGALLGAGVAASTVALLLRGWVVGTYVNDQGIVIDTLLRRTRITWADVTAVEWQAARTPLLGLPLPIPGERSVVHDRRGFTFPTHVYTSSPDLLWRPDALDMARIRLENWAKGA
jgi:hypothetical protein